MPKKRAPRTLRIVERGPFPYDWLRAAEHRDPRVIQQSNPTSCTAACLQMLLASNANQLTQEELAQRYLHGSPAFIDSVLPTLLQLDPASNWTFTLFAQNDSFRRLDRLTPWLAFLTLSNPSGIVTDLHAVIVQAATADDLLIFDPHRATAYSMQRDHFNARFTGIAIFRSAPRHRARRQSSPK
ncbi:MAG TPA: hypothetical protein VH253_10750 [Phycisphaerae bacterium]|nr:hypothetical protein [Phycisphaerae bacterium]